VMWIFLPDVGGGSTSHTYTYLPQSYEPSPDPAPRESLHKVRFGSKLLIESPGSAAHVRRSVAGRCLPAPVDKLGSGRYYEVASFREFMHE